VLMLIEHDLRYAGVAPGGRRLLAGVGVGHRIPVARPSHESSTQNHVRTIAQSVVRMANASIRAIEQGEKSRHKKNPPVRRVEEGGVIRPMGSKGLTYFEPRPHGRDGLGCARQAGPRPASSPIRSVMLNEKSPNSQHIVDTVARSPYILCTAKSDDVAMTV
jgi:hypothetical protein